GRGVAEDFGRGQMRLEGFARSGDAVGEDCVEAGRCGQARLDEWGEAEGYGGDVAAGYGDAFRVGQCFALLRAVGGEQFGQAVGPGALVVGAVELLPGGRADESVVGGEVDDEGVRARLLEL